MRAIERFRTVHRARLADRALLETLLVLCEASACESFDAAHGSEGAGCEPLMYARARACSQIHEFDVNT